MLVAVGERRFELRSSRLGPIARRGEAGRLALSAPADWEPGTYRVVLGLGDQRSGAELQARPGVAGVGLGVTAFALIHIVEANLSLFQPRAVVALLLSLAVGLAGLTVERHRIGSAQRRRLIEQLRAWPLPPVSGVTPDLVGVFPSPSGGDEVEASYLVRDVDAAIERALARGPVTLIIGGPGAGKSASSHRAARRVLGDRPAIVPVDGPALHALLRDPALAARNNALWWLDDLQRFLPHLDGSDLALLLDGDHTVLATMRDNAWKESLNAPGDEGERARRLRTLCHLIEIERGPSVAKSHAARDADPQPGRSYASEGSRGSPTAGTSGGRPAAGRLEARRDPVTWMGAAATALALSALGATIQADGFSAPKLRSVAAQMDDVRGQAQRAGLRTRYTFGPQVLHGSAQQSVGFILTPVSGHGSDELRIYDTRDGRLHERLSFRPATRGCRGLLVHRPRACGAFSGSGRTIVQHRSDAVDYAIVAAPVLTDVDHDGNREVLVAYRALADEFPPRVLRLLAMVTWNDASNTYALSALPGARGLSRFPVPRTTRKRMLGPSVALVDTRPGRQRTLHGDAVSSFRIFAGPIIATAIETPRLVGPHRVDSRVSVTLLTLAIKRGHPVLQAICVPVQARARAGPNEDQSALLLSVGRRMFRAGRENGIFATATPEAAGFGTSGVCE